VFFCVLLCRVVQCTSLCFCGQDVDLVIPGLILAAGRSHRMGRPKALLPAGASGPSFVQRVADTLRAGGLEDILVVGRPEDNALRAEVERLGANVRFVVNTHADEGQLSSLITGLNVVDHPGTRAIVVMPVDVPLVSSDSVAAILAAFMRTRAPIVRATHLGRHGHPVLFSHAIFAELRRADPAQGAKAVLRNHAAEIVDIDVPDPAVVEDVDSPEDYARLFGKSIDRK
jgi:molybdenum cofactor cytidylyltransferase